MAAATIALVLPRIAQTNTAVNSRLTSMRWANAPKVPGKLRQTALSLGSVRPAYRSHLGGPLSKTVGISPPERPARSFESGATRPRFRCCTTRDICPSPLQPAMSLRQLTCARRHGFRATETTRPRGSREAHSMGGGRPPADVCTSAAHNSLAQRLSRHATERPASRTTFQVSRVEAVPRGAPMANDKTNSVLDVWAPVGGSC